MRLVILNPIMKKLFWIVLLLLAAYLLYKFAFKKEQVEKEKPKAVSVSAHTDVFNNSVENVLTQYYALTDAFVNWDSTAVRTAGLALQTALSDFNVEELKKDSTIYETALYPLEISKVSVGSVLDNNDWEQKRRALQDLSESIRMLLLTVKYDNSIAYWQECPMAFGAETIGNWLSAKEEVVNPYLGNKDPKYGATMLNCGEVKEKIDFTVTDTIGH